MILQSHPLKLYPKVMPKLSLPIMIFLTPSRLLYPEPMPHLLSLTSGNKTHLKLRWLKPKPINQIASELPHLEHYILSSLPDGRTLAGRQFQNILPYNAKALIRHDLAENYPSLWKKTTEVFVAFYFQNWVKYSMVLGPYKVCLSFFSALN